MNRVISRTDFIVDELGYVPLSPTGAELLFEAFSQRYERGSTIVTWRWCMEASEVARPPPLLVQAARTETGLATRIMRLSTSTAMAASPCCAGKPRARSLGPMVAL